VAGHARGCASEVKHNLDRFFEVQGFVKPGVGVETITYISSKRRLWKTAKKKGRGSVMGSNKECGKK
jgi:hypothetical protein